MTELARVFNEDGWQTLVGGFRMLDVGIVTAAELIANGPKTLYVPSGFEFVGPSWSSEGAVPLNPYHYIYVIVSENNGGSSGGSGGYDFTYESGYDGYATAFYTADPVKAYLTGSGVRWLYPLSAWRAAHEYPDYGCISGPDPSNGDEIAGWYALPGGTSGDVEPVWDSANSPITDGTIDWYFGGILPTVGAVHPILWNATPRPYQVPS